MNLELTNPHYYYLFLNNNRGNIIHTTHHYVKFDDLNQFSPLDKHNLVDIAGVKYVKPTIMVSYTDSKIILPKVSSHNLKIIKELLTHIYQNNDAKRDNMIISIEDTDTQETDTSLLIDIFGGIIVHVTPKSDDLIKLCYFMKNCNYTFRSINIIKMENEESYHLDDFCKRLSSDVCKTQIFNCILRDNTNLKKVFINKLIINEDNFECKNLNTLQSFDVNIIILPGELFRPVTPPDVLIKYVVDVLSCHNQSIKTISIRCMRTSRFIWTEMCERNIRWLYLSSISIHSYESELYETGMYYYFPLLTRFNIQYQNEIYEPRMNIACKNHGSVENLSLGLLATLLAKNRKRVKATNTWLILAKFYLKDFALCKDITLKIARMMIFDYKDNIKLNTNDFVYNHAICENQTTPCEILSFVTSSEMKIWTQLERKLDGIKSLEYKERKAQEIIDNSNRLINKKLGEIDNLKTRIDKKRLESKKLQNELSSKKDKYTKSLKRLKRDDK